jgi:hypothetical protein
VLLEEALYTYVLGDADVAALVDDRMYPFRLAEGCDLPAIAFQRISAARMYTFDAFANTAAWVTARMQFSCWGTSALDALKVGHAVMLALSGYEGSMAGIYVGSAFAALEVDTYESNDRKYRRVVDFYISYEEDVSTEPGGPFSSAFSEAFA